MGCDVFAGSVNFRIRASNKAAALAAIQDFERRMTEKYAWYRRHPVPEHDTLEDELEAKEWQVYTDSEGNVTDISLENGRLGWEVDSPENDESGGWMNAIAPFVEPGAKVFLEDTDGNYWCWYFDGKTLTEYAGMITYPGLPED